MKIVVAADLHYHPRWSEALARFARKIRDEQPACFVLAGDVGHPLSNFRQGLALFADLDCPRLVLAGNHDLWAGRYDSQTLWAQVLEATAQEAGFVWLERDNVRLGSLGICGTLGWYDYSARDPALEVSDEDYYVNKGMFNNDGNYVNWAYTDQEFAGQLLEGFSVRLSALCDAPSVTQVLVVTHTPPFEENLLRKPGDFNWAFGNAYFGNLTLGQAIVRCPKVSHVVSGHTHIGGRWQIPTPHGILESFVVGSDYGQPAYVILDFPWIVAL